MNDGPGSSHLDLDAPYLKVRVGTSINKRQIASVNFIPSRTWHSRTCTYGRTEPKSKMDGISLLPFQNNESFGESTLPSATNTKATTRIAQSVPKSVEHIDVTD